MALWRKFHELLEGAFLDTAAAEHGASQRGIGTVAPDAGTAADGWCGFAKLSSRVDARGSPPDTGAAFTMAVIALSAKMAKADGIVVPIEVDVFGRMFTVPEAEQRNVRRLFDLAAKDTAGFEAYAAQIRTMLRDDPHLLRDVLDSLFHIASADRAIHPQEIAFLEEVGRQFGLSEATFRHIRAQFVADSSSPYDVLGLDPGVSDELLKQRYRKLVRENHPDLVIGRGLPADVIEVANRKLQAITDAYGVLARERGL